IVRKLEDSLFHLYNQPDVHEKPKALEDRGGAFYSVVACGLMASIYNDKKDIQTVNALNKGAIPTLPYNAVIEANCVITRHGPQPIAIGEIPLAIRGQIYQMKA